MIAPGGQWCYTLLCYTCDNQN